MEPRARGPRPTATAALVLAAALALAGPVGRAGPGAAHAQEAPSAATSPAPSPTAVAPTPIPAAQVFPVGEELETFLRDVERLLQPDPSLQKIATRVPEYSARIAARIESTSEMIADGAQLQALDKLASAWYTVQAQLARAASVVDRRAAAVEAVLQQIERWRETWTVTRVAMVADDVPAMMVARIDSALADLGKARQQVDRLRAQTLDLQSEIVARLVDVDAALARIGDARLARVGSLLRRDARPVWQIDLGPSVREEILPRSTDLIVFELNEAREFIVTHAGTLLLAALLFVALCIWFRRARTTTISWSETEPDIERKTVVFQRPYSSAFILFVFAVRVFHLQMPHLLAQILAVSAIVPIVRLLRLAAPPDIRPALWMAIVFFLLAQVRDLVSALPQLEQVAFIVEALVMLAFVVWLRRGRSERARRVLDALAIPKPLLVVDATLLTLAASVTAAVLGYMQFARLLGGTLLAGAYVAVSLYVALRAADGLIALALRAGPVARLRAVGHFRELIERRTHRFLVWFVVGLWCLGVARSLAFDQIVLSAARTILAAPVTPVGWDITLGDVVLTGGVIWAAFLVSRLVRFVLEEEVYPRVELPRGIPYALSTVLHYVLLVSGFVLALGAIGLDLNRFTILAGAFGVGIGFGLQNVVNNFVSGLILLFERPVQVGDSVQIGELIGEVRRIGIRSSTVRTWHGAEVIVPNGNLISEQVTNWTLSDRTRRIDIPIGVAYGSDPERVIEILRGVGRGHPAVMNDPAPLAVFVRFGDSSLDFELRVWTNRFEQYAITRSDLGIAVLRALGDAGIGIPFPHRDVHVQSIEPTAARALAQQLRAAHGAADGAAASPPADAGGDARPARTRAPADSPAQGES